MAPRGHAHLLPPCALLPPTMLLASCIMYVEPPQCRAGLNLVVYSLVRWCPQAINSMALQYQKLPIKYDAVCV